MRTEPLLQRQPPAFQAVPVARSDFTGTDVTGTDVAGTDITGTEVTRTAVTRTGASRQMSSARPRVIHTAARLARRRAIVRGTKWGLPGVAVLLLLSVALWPEISRVRRQEENIGRQLFAAESARMRAPHYRGVDQRGRPYTITADSALQPGPQRIELQAPKGDQLTDSGDWLYVQSQEGVYLQHAGQLDLSGEVNLYRSDGLTMRTVAAAVDMKQGAAAGHTRTHVEGPFGTLDAQGFMLLDKGATIQFTGPARLVVEQSK